MDDFPRGLYLEIALKRKIKQSKNATGTKLYLYTKELLRIPKVKKVHSLLMFPKFMLHSLPGCFQPIDKVLGGKLYSATLHPNSFWHSLLSLRQ